MMVILFYVLSDVVSLCRTLLFLTFNLFIFYAFSDACFRNFCSTLMFVFGRLFSFQMLFLSFRHSFLFLPLLLFFFLTLTLPISLAHHESSPTARFASAAKPRRAQVVRTNTKMAAERSEVNSTKDSVKVTEKQQSRERYKIIEETIQHRFCAIWRNLSPLVLDNSLCF
ncbi:hypothetical protein C8J56DRAFT_924881 [Mycena floridula]|nr:hypothetical protein C8J56DRAFT_924881 [Mycena floridula]